MTRRQNPPLIELLQLLPVLSLAFPFILQGKVDLSRAGSGFLLGAALALVVSGVVWRGKHLFNPILVGANLWLVAGALALNLPLAPLASGLIALQATGLFVGAFCVGVVATLVSPHGYVGARSDDARWIRRASLALLSLTAAIVGWAWLFRHNVRLGGGLPFIVINVARRLITRRAPA